MINLKSIVVAGLLALGVTAAFAQSCNEVDPKVRTDLMAV